VVLYQPEHQAQVRALEASARSRRPDLAFEAHCIPVASPIDHLEIFSAVSSLAARLNDRFPPGGRDGLLIDGHEYFVCISQGTPAMHAVWMILVQAEILRARMLQTVPPHYLKPGEPCAREVSLDLRRSPMPVVQGLKRTGAIEYEDRRRGGPPSLLASFLAANVYGPTDDYGLYLLTHTPPSRERVEACLGHVEEDLRQVQDYLSPDGLRAIRDYIGGARASFRVDFDAFKTWSLDHREALKRRFRLGLEEWANAASETYRGRLEISTRVDDDASRHVRGEIYCEAEVVRRGLDVIVENAWTRAYAGDHVGPRELVVSVRLDRGNLVVSLEDHGRGFTEVAMKFHKGPGSSGGGLEDLRKLDPWFQDLTVESTCRVRYDVKRAKEVPAPGPGTGTRYTLAYRLPIPKSTGPGAGVGVDDPTGPGRSILVVDSRDAGRPEARLPQVLAALRGYRARSTGVTTTWLADGSGQHDLEAYDLALVHETDAERDEGAFLRRCEQGSKPCVLYSGGVDQAEARSPRLLIVRDSDVLAHAEDGVSFLERYGRLSTIAWTRGFRAARLAEATTLINQLRTPLLLPSPANNAATPAWASIVEQLRDWSDDPRYLDRVDRLERLDRRSPGDVSTILDILDELARYA
jgi:hypothetical protein